MGSVWPTGAMGQVSSVISLAFFLQGISKACSKWATKNVDFSGITQPIPHHQPTGDEQALLGAW